MSAPHRRPGAGGQCLHWDRTGDQHIPRKRQLIVNGDKVPGYMAAMIMGYKVADSSLLDGLNPQK